MRETAKMQLARGERKQSFIDSKYDIHASRSYSARVCAPTTKMQAPLLRAGATIAQTMMLSVTNQQTKQCTMRDEMKDER